MSMTYAHPNLAHSRDLRDVLRAEGAQQLSWHSTATSSPPAQLPSPPAQRGAAERSGRGFASPDAFLQRLEETENLSAAMFNLSPKIFNLKPESRSPPNFPQGGRYDLFYKDSALVPKLDHVRRRQKIPGEARAELW